MSPARRERLTAGGPGRCMAPTTDGGIYCRVRRGNEECPSACCCDRRDQHATAYWLHEVQQVMGKEIQTFLDYPPMQKGASFNLDAIKAEMGKKMEEAALAAKGIGN